MKLGPNHWECEDCGDEFEGENAAQRYSAHFNTRRHREAVGAIPDEDSTKQMGQGGRGRADRGGQPRRSRPSVGQLAGQDERKGEKIALFNTKKKILSGASGILAGLAWAHYPEIMMFVLTFPTAIVGLGGYGAVRFGVVGERMATAVFLHTFQYYLAVFFVWIPTQYLFHPEILDPIVELLPSL